MADGEFDSPKSWIVAAVVCFIFFGFGMWGSIDAYRDADERGIVKAGRGTIEGEYPWHFFLDCPTASLLAGGFLPLHGVEGRARVGNLPAKVPKHTLPESIILKR